MNTYRSLLCALLLGMAPGIIAQNNADEQDMKDRVEAYRAQFITEQLALTPEEAQQFWPVYNEYRRKLDAIQHERVRQHFRDKGQQKEELSSMSEAEIYQMVETEMDRQQELLNLRREYHKRFDQVLPIRKVAMLYRAEADFQRRLIRRLRERGSRGRD